MPHYIYHRVPKDFTGDIIYPLNELQQKMPNIYAAQARKYTGREETPKQTIPLFNNCLWNDVIFTSAVHPQTIFNARRDAGWPDMPPVQFFKINTDKLDHAKLGIYLFRPERHAADPLSSSDFAPFTDATFNNYTTLPQATRDYFIQERADKHPRIRLFFKYVPHILYYGQINTKQHEIITVQ